MKIEIYQMQKVEVEIKDFTFYENCGSYLGIYPNHCIGILKLSDYCVVKKSSYQDSSKLNADKLAVEITETEFNKKLAECLFIISGVEICPNPVLTLNY